MADERADLISEHLRRVDAKLVRVIEEVTYIKVRVTSLEGRVAQRGRWREPPFRSRRSAIGSHQRRLDLVDQPH